ncbi:MAG: ribose 5-phosphate isomerase A [Candidatus Diapherotrites archaeon CG10_big_fil_rev_8_21_14_0_10_31_34]|nr:MAG: ribose 5-phosphate isomerase A [Candidatus Diapherotrites archaeon CG10_big_fil_rev_8_21_14_0_10_31_34]
MIPEDQIELLVEKYIKHGQTIGIGSSELGIKFLKKMALRKEIEGLDLKIVPTSAEITFILKQLNLEIGSLDEKEVDVAIEFADLVDYNYNYIKRDSKSFVRDKMIAQSAKDLIIIARKQNFVSKLFGVVPFEVSPFWWKRTKMQLESMGAARERKTNESLTKTESGNYVIDVLTDSIPFPEEFEFQAKEIPGVLETGLFVGYADRILLYEKGKIEVKSRIGKE